MRGRKNWMLVVMSLIFIAGSHVALAQTEQKTVSEADKKFMHEAASGGMMEVTLGQMAMNQAASDGVKQFGNRMVADHTKVNQQMMQLAQKKGVELPKEMDAKHKEKVDKLSKLKRAEFDREYMALMVEDHQKDVSSFNKQAKEGQDADVKALAAGTLPVLEEHLKMAKDLHGKVSGGKQ